MRGDLTVWRTESVALKGSVLDGFRRTGLTDEFAAVAWPDREYTLGSDARLLPGTRERIRLDALAMTEEATTVRARG